ncbi:type VI secretion system protein TssA [Luteimonas sp. FCS-9]|uniref:type VI secretion system protein TssA n=1 Tax=Luteimonas sp. FCS-9 TaxID=1547516 RepID=UPI00063EAB9E|nr:type VI secretion system protein TssA [Luteimonas sp. FCS-9]KLJ02878.1 type VI secretion protein [Luteimonas sp. FCS-9]
MLEQDDLLAPISDHAPCGEDLSFSPEFDAIQEARRADDPTLAQGEWVTELKYADWSRVLATTETLLRERTKDLRLAAWYAEARAQLHGFPGLAAGYRLVAGLCERFWDALHPAASDGDQEDRIGNLTWLLGNSQQWLRALPIIQAPQGRFGLADVESAHARAGEQDQAATLEAIEAARRDTPHAFYMRLSEELPDCAAALRELQQAVDARLGLDGPNFSRLRDQLDTLERTVRRFARDAGVLLDGEPVATSQAVPDNRPAEAPSTPGVPAGPIATRRQAIAQLRQVAEFFRRTEPHSPVAYLADKAARWGEMPLHVWLKRVIKDDSTLAQVEELLDVEPQDGLSG